MPTVDNLIGKTIKEVKMRVVSNTHQVLILRFTDDTVLTIEAVEGVMSLFGEDKKGGKANENQKRIRK